MAKRAGDTWKREPGRSVLRVAVTGNRSKPVPLDLPDSGGLKLVVTARQADGMERLGLAAGTRSVSVFVVNDRRPAPDERKDEAMAFQVRLTLRASQPFVARPNTTASRRKTGTSASQTSSTATSSSSGCKPWPA